MINHHHPKYGEFIYIVRQNNYILTYYKNYTYAIIETF